MTLSGFLTVPPFLMTERLLHHHSSRVKELNVLQLKRCVISHRPAVRNSPFGRLPQTGTDVKSLKLALTNFKKKKKKTIIVFFRNASVLATVIASRASKIGDNGSGAAHSSAVVCRFFSFFFVRVSTLVLFYCQRGEVCSSLISITVSSFPITPRPPQTACLLLKIKNGPVPVRTCPSSEAKGALRPPLNPPLRTHSKLKDPHFKSAPYARSQ